MKLTCPRSTLTTAVQTVGGVVSNKTTKPVLQNIKLSVRNGVAILQATDTEIGIRYVLEGLQSDDLELLLPARRIAEILREATASEIEIQADGQNLVIRAGHSEYRLPTTDAAEFPDIPTLSTEQGIVLSSAELRKMIRRTVFCADQESTRYCLGGILLDVTPEQLNLVGTDGRRLAMVHAACRLEGEQQKRVSPPIIPAKAMSLVERSIPDTDAPTCIAIQASEVLVKAGATTVYSRLLEGRFPRYQDVIPKDAKVTVDLVAGQFLSAIRQAQIVTSEESRGVDFKFEKGTLRLRSKASEIGQSDVDMPIAYTDSPITITFDPRYLADYLKVLTPETCVHLELTSGNNAATIKTDDGYLYVIMPLSRD